MGKYFEDWKKATIQNAVNNGQMAQEGSNSGGNHEDVRQ